MSKSNRRDEDVLPVEKQKIKGKFKHVILTIPALDEKWVTPRIFGFYTFPPTKRKDGKYITGAKAEWLEMMSFILDDIWWLCELPYHKFWCQMIFDKEAMNSIRSFLHLAPLQKLYFRIEDDEILTMYKRIKKAVFQFLKRLTRTEESALHFMGEEKYEEIMTSCNLISISLIFCICSVFEKQKETKRMVHDVFNYNKSLKLDEVVLRTTQLFSWLKKKMKNGYMDMRKNMEYCECDDLNDILNSYRKCIVTAIQCLTNAALSVSNFLSVFEDACDVFSNYDFEYHIVRTFRKLLIPLYEEVNLLFGDTYHDEVRSRLFSMLNITRNEFLKIFYACLQCPVKKLSSNRESFDVVHNYVRILKFSLKVEEFVFDFNDKYNIEEISNAIRKCNSQADLTEFENIKKVMIETYEKLKHVTENSSIAAPVNTELNRNLTNDFNNLKLDNSIEINDLIEKYCTDFEFEAEDDNSDGESAGSDNSKEFCNDDVSSEYSDWTKSDNSDAEYDSYLTHDDLENVEGLKNGRRESKDSVGQIKIDHKYDSYNADYSKDQPGPSGVNSRISCTQLDPKSELELAIAQVKEFLPHLGDGFIVMCLEHYKLDSSLVINAILENTLAPALKSLDQSLPYIPLELLKDTEYNAKNSNIADKDDNLKELRKTEYKSYMEMLNDKKDVENFKDIYDKYQIVSHSLYDDDVEEDYEEDAIAALEPDPESFYNTLKNAPFNKFDEDSEEDDDDDENNTQIQTTGSKNIKPPLDFCQNPEITRALAERRRRAKEERSHKKPYRNSNQAADKPSNSENANDQTNRDRRYKNVNKSRAANHNRRYLSDRKRKF